MDTEISCVGFIMDGNRRWAKEHGLASYEGYQTGYNALKEIIKWVHSRKIAHMVCYAFSTENWNRSKEEIEYLMSLLEFAVRDLLSTFQKNNATIAVRFVGQKDRLSEKLQTVIQDAESKNPMNPELTVWVALSYGGRAEIVHAANRAIVENAPVTESSFKELLWTRGMPDPDLVIRTGGEYRISNFLLWQCAYSELFFTETLWPDFGEAEFQSMLEAYGTRARRRGI
jgi:undecaprenyl diphosphate synthase